MRFVSWNVNGFRAVLEKGFEEFFNSVDADIFALQETKLQPEQAKFMPDGYFRYLSSAEKKGYSGTAVYTKAEPIDVKYGIDGKYSDEGRLITCEYDNFYFVCSYTPNSQQELKRLAYRMEFEDDLRVYLTELNKSKPVVLCGDLNVARSEIDLKNPKTNIGNPGFSYEERAKMSQLLSSGFIDTFRYFYPDKTDAYTWWSYMFKAREKNTGWRIDYFITSNDLGDKLRDSLIYSEVYGSDHCPVGLEIEL